MKLAKEILTLAESLGIEKLLEVNVSQCPPAHIA